MEKKERTLHYETVPWVLGKFHALVLHIDSRDGAMYRNELFATKYVYMYNTHAIPYSPLTLFTLDCSKFFYNANCID